MKLLRSWREQKIILQRWFPNLKEEDFFFDNGQKETMLDRLADKLNKTREELEMIFTEVQRH